MANYPAYISLAGASSLDELAEMTPEMKHAEGILQRFLALVLAVA